MSLTKINPKKLKETPFITAFNKTHQQYEPVLFANGLTIDLPDSAFRRGIVMSPGTAPSITANTLYNEDGALKFDGTTIGGPGTAAPNTPEYLITDSAVPSDIPNARVFKAGSNITLTEATGELTIASTAASGGGGRGDADATYLVLSVTGSLSAERVLTAGDGIDLTDAGAGSTATVAVDVTDFIDTSNGLTESTNNIQVSITSNEGLDFNGATGALEVDVTDFIDTSYGLTESSNNIQINLYVNGGLSFDGGALKVNTSDGVTNDGSGNIVADPQDSNVVLAGTVFGG